jgi:hypothetical protein
MNTLKRADHHTGNKVGVPKSTYMYRGIVKNFQKELCKIRIFGQINQ